MRALITAGGTSEPIDDVRVITNLSSGRFGAHIANALVARGVEVTLLASQGLMGHPEWVDDRVERVPFGSFADLAARLEEHTASPPDLLFMAAAVSDYSPVRQHGKIRSTDEEVVLRMRRTPKLLSTLRTACGPSTFLVGFKLLSGVTRDELVRVAERQRTTNTLDLTCANDLATFGPSLHPIVLVEDGQTSDYWGSKEESAAFLVDNVLDRLLRSDRAPETRSGASVALLDRKRRRVVLGRRKTGAFIDHWAVPGGRIEPGETPLQAARRELHEETGLHTPHHPPLAQVEVLVPASPPWHITSFVFEADDFRRPKPNDEIDAAWVDLDEARGRSPLALGTDVVLDRVRLLLERDTMAGGSPSR